MCYEIDLKLGQLLGRDKSCLGKIPYKTLKLAKQAVEKHNSCQFMNHKVHKYNCGFCGNYHIGRKWHVDDVKLLFKTYIKDKDELENLLELLPQWDIL